MHKKGEFKWLLLIIYIDAERLETLLDFYSIALDHAELEVQAVKEVDVKCLAWCEACAQVAKKVSTLNIPENLCITNSQREAW